MPLGIVDDAYVVIHRLLLGVKCHQRGCLNYSGSGVLIVEVSRLQVFRKSSVNPSFGPRTICYRGLDNHGRGFWGISVYYIIRNPKQVLLVVFDPYIVG